jgi:NAD(P) transhydrogenase subunit alpha
MEAIFIFFSSNYNMITIVILSIFLGIEVISRVPSVLHTPLMSGANAIHGVVVIGAIIVMGQAESNDYLVLTLGFLAVILGTLNVVGGFVVTDRMLEMFSKKKNSKK